MGWSDPAGELQDIQAWFDRRGLELAVQPYGDIWRAWVTVRDSTSGEGAFIDGGSPLEAAQRARRHHIRRQFRSALGSIGQMAQSEVGQLLIAEVALTKLPLGKRPMVKRTVIASGIWMLDSRRRKAARELGRAAGDWMTTEVSERRVGGHPINEHPALPAAKQAAQDSITYVRRLYRK
jgi:hypothetical protein